MILTITLNPSIDISVAVDALIPEDKLRCEQYEKEVGGGGINVAKGLSRLGLGVNAMFFAAGKNGQWIIDRLRDDHIKTIPVQTLGETRENINITDQSSSLEYRLVNKGSGTVPQDESNLLALAYALEPTPNYVIVSGSTPKGISALFFKHLAEWCQHINARLVLDIPADQLKSCLRFHPFLIKPNLKEFLQLAGKAKMKKTEMILHAKWMIAHKKATNIAISLGEKGGMLINADQVVQLRPPATISKSTVGAGDSMVAGMTYQFAQNANLPDVLRLGLACGTAATLKKGTKLFDPKVAWRLFKDI